MRLLYDNDGNIWRSVYDDYWFRFRHSIHIPLSEYYIEEINPENQDLCFDLAEFGNRSKVDENGLNKYYIDNGELHVRDGWEEYED
jgi:hypothetical protein